MNTQLSINCTNKENILIAEEFKEIARAMGVSQNKVLVAMLRDFVKKYRNVKKFSK